MRTRCATAAETVGLDSPVPAASWLRLCRLLAGSGRWARENFVPADLRQATWHPVILEEMTRKERDIRSSDAGRLLVTQA